MSLSTSRNAKVTNNSNVLTIKEYRGEAENGDKAAGTFTNVELEVRRSELQPFTEGAGVEGSSK